MKKFLILFAFLLSSSIISAQSIDSVKVQYNPSAQILNVGVFGRIFTFDPDALVGIKTQLPNDTVAIDLDFRPCSPWQTIVDYDTIITISLTAMAPGSKIARIRSFVLADLDTTCYYLSQTTKRDSVFIPFNIPISIFEEGIESLNIYPNPTNGVFFVDLESAIKTKYSVYSITGKLMLRENLPENGKVDISQFPSGLYFLRLNVDGKITTRKIMKE